MTRKNMVIISAVFFLAMASACAFLAARGLISVRDAVCHLTVLAVGISMMIF